MSKIKAEMLSVGAAVPEKVLSNSDLEKMVDTNDEWIVKRTGIKTRRIMDKSIENPASTLGAKAAEIALDRAGVKAEDVDAVICATFTPDNFFPSTACGIANKIGAPTAFAFDISAACSGFIYGLTVAKSLIESGQNKTVLLVGAEIISRALDWDDRNTCILFGDGAGAVVLRATEEDKGVLAASANTDSTLGDILHLRSFDGKQNMFMNGNEVFKQAVRLMTKSTEETLEKCSMGADDVDLLIPHQANMRIINSVSKKLGVTNDRVIANVSKYGNTSSASIPIALNEAWEDGRVKEGTVVAFAALGGGITYGSALVRF
jgi:3-oxoacyl-[acyl-carrier-protein] synthase-3